MYLSGRPNIFIKNKTNQTVFDLTNDEMMKMYFIQVTERYRYIQPLKDNVTPNTTLSELKKQLLHDYESKISLNEFYFVKDDVFILNSQENDIYCSDIVTEKGYLIYICPLIRKDTLSEKNKDLNSILKLQNSWRVAEYSYTKNPNKS